MKTLMKATSLLFAIATLLSTSIASAALYNTVNGSGEITDFSSTGYEYINTVNNFTSTTTGPDEAYLIVDANPNSIDGLHLQDALSAIGSSFILNDFTSSGNDVHPGLVSNDTSGSFTANGFTFNGFIVKGGNKTFVGLFDNAVSQIFWDTFFAPNPAGTNFNGMSHIAFFNTSISEVPVPAALWLFAPALMGLIGIRKRYTV